MCIRDSSPLRSVARREEQSFRSSRSRLSRPICFDRNIGLSVERGTGSNRPGMSVGRWNSGWLWCDLLTRGGQMLLRQRGELVSAAVPLHICYDRQRGFQMCIRDRSKDTPTSPWSWCGANHCRRYIAVSIASKSSPLCATSPKQSTPPTAWESSIADCVWNPIEWKIDHGLC